MLKVDLRQAVAGMTLALPVVHPRQPQHTLLRMGYALEDDVVRRLLAVGVRFVWVRCPKLDFLCSFVNSDVVESQAQVYAQISDTFGELQSQSTPRISYQHYTRSIGKLVQDLVANPQAALFLGDLSEAEPTGLDLLRHSSSVTYLSVLMGLKLEGYLVRQRRHIDPLRAKEVTNLGVGAMLHDVGVSHLPQDVCQAYVESRDESDPRWQEHPTLGYRMVREHVEPSAATVVLNHHQRFDGSGYAGSGAPVLEGLRIHVFARVAALADFFDRLREAHRPQSRPTVAVLRHVLDPRVACGFDPQVIAALLAVVPPYPPGSRLTLSDGRTGIAVSHTASDPCRLTVQLIADPHAGGDDLTLGEMVDLSEENRGVEVVECDGQDVSTLNFRPSASLRQHMTLGAAW